METTSLRHSCRHLLCWFVALAVTAIALPVTLAAPAPAQSGCPQKLAVPDAVPEGLSTPDWSSIRQQYEQQRHTAFLVEGGYQARNPGQQWHTRFDGRGFLTQPDAGGWQWGLELRGYGFPGQERVVTHPRRVSAASQRVTYEWDATLQEWFVNDRHGLEHGFTVKERPVGAPALNSQSSTLNLLLSVHGGLRPEVQADGRGVRFVDAQGTAAVTYAGLTVLDADGRALPARFEPMAISHRREGAEVDTQPADPVRLGTSTATESLRLVIDERGARYPLTIDPIAQQAYFKASNTGASDMFGASVAVSGDTVVVGAWGEASTATGVNGNQSDNSVPNAGAAYVFVRNGTTWTQQAYLKASNTGPSDYFGSSVSVSGDTVVVGAWGEASTATGVNGDQIDNSAVSSGAAYVFVRDGTTWSQQAYLKASNTGADDYFGQSVAVSGDTVVVGANREASNATGADGDGSDNSALYSGATYVFVRSGTTWTQQAYLKAANTEAYDFFGQSVAVSGDTVVVGALGEDSSATGVNGNQIDNSAGSSGAAYVFVRSGTAWSQQAYLKPSNTEADDYFGQSVAVSGDTVVVGALGEDSNTTGVNGNQFNNSAGASGAAYVFVRNGTTWSQQTYLKASNTEANDNFGLSVAVSGDAVVVGAPNESSNATGVNGDGSDNSAFYSGAAYVFVRSGTNWTQQAYLKASNTEANDYFGGSVAMSGGTVMVGADLESSHATGVDGDGSDNSVLNSGAAYIFAGLLGPSLSLAPDGSGGYFLRFKGVPDLTYRLQRAPSVTGAWDTIFTQIAPASGLIEYHETSPLPAAAFYRTIQP